MKLRRVLVAVEFPGEADQPGLDKAIALAAASGARLKVLHVAYDPDAGRYGGGAAQRDIEYMLGLRRAQLDRLVDGRRRRGLRVSTRVEWGRPAYELIGAAAKSFKADLVLGQSARRGLVCMHCGAPIGPSRLEAVPCADQCADCERLEHPERRPVARALQ